MRAEFEENARKLLQGLQYVFQKLMVAQLLKKFYVLLNSKIHYRAHKSLLTDLIPEPD